MRSFLVGLYSGFLLSALRAPLGLELLQVPARDPHAAAAYRGAALLLVAVGLVLGLRRAPEGFSATKVLAGATAGFAAHWTFGGLPPDLSAGVAFSALLVLVIVASHRGGANARPDKGRILLAAVAALVGWLLLRTGSPEGHVAAIVAALAGTAAIALVGHLGAPRDAAPLAPLEGGRLAGLVVAGVGLAFLLEGLARPLRQLGAGLPLDDSVFASVLLGLSLFGALAFGRLFASAKAAEVGRALVLVASFALVLVAGSVVLTNVSTVAGLDRFVRRFGLDLSLHGTVRYDTVLAATVFVAPAFALGTVIALCRKPAELAALLVGGAAGLVLATSQLHYAVERVDGLLVASQTGGGHSLALAFTGAGVAAAGAALRALSSDALGRGARASLAALGVAATVGCWVAHGRVARLEFSRPWEQRPPRPTLFVDALEGVVTVEDAPGGGALARLDGVALAPAPSDAAADLARLRQSFSLLPEGTADPRVLLVGQLTPARAALLHDLGVASVDRSGAWFGLMGVLEEALFGAPPELAGEVLDPRAARQRLADGAYDLVLVPPLAGELPTTRNLASPAATTVVVWLDGASGAARLVLGREVLVDAPRLAELYVGVVHGPGVEAARARRGFGVPALYAAGAPVPPPPAIELLHQRAYDRGIAAKRRLAQRLAAAEQAPGVLSVLAAHFAAQRIDNKWESEALAMELEDEVQDALGRAAAGPTPDALTVQAAEALARVLGEKRRVDALYPTLGPAAERHAPWPALEVALAQADLELLDPAAAVERLEPLLAGRGGSAAAWAMLAEGQQQLGHDEDAARSLERALALAPENEELERRLAVAAVRAGRPDGPQRLARALDEAPQSEELLRYRGAGPWGPPRQGYHPLSRGEHGH